MKLRSLALIGVLLSAALATGRSAAAEPELALEALFGQPYADRMGFNRVNGHPSGEYGRDQSALRIRNTGDAPLTISQLPVTGPWDVNTQLGITEPALPATIQPAGFLDVPISFTANSGDFHQGTLRIVSNDADEGNLTVPLAGFWQSMSEGGMEPGLGHIARVFGISTTIVGPGQRLNEQGAVEQVGEEILSPYWRRADTTRPVTVKQLAAFHGCCTAAARFSWHVSTNTQLLGSFRHAPVDGQALLPRLADPNSVPANSLPYTDNRPAQSSFTPTAAQEPFGFNLDGVWSDPARNSQTGNGHLVRVWPVRNAAGTIVPNSYLVAGDYQGINYDYQDNIFLIDNIVPATAASSQPFNQSKFRLDVSGTRNYLDANGNLWTPDTGTGYFSPASAPLEGQTIVDIEPTRDDVLYSTYRGNTGSQAPVLTYNIPVGPRGTYFYRLYFAERFWNEAGRRVQDVLAEGEEIAEYQNIDIFARAGGRDRSYTTGGRGRLVTDGFLTLTFRADENYPSISGIEVYCNGVCPGGTTPTVTPTPSPTPSPTPGPTLTPTPVPSASPSPSPSPSASASPRPSASAQPSPTASAPAQPTQRPFRVLVPMATTK